MSIIAYVGRPRSGKSYGVVENVIIPALKSGRTIVTNIPLKIGYLTEDFPEGKIIQFKPSEPLSDPNFFDLDKWAGAIIIIDEAWRYWSTGIKASQIPEIQKSFFTEHGHCVGEDGLTCEIVLVTQQLDQVSSFVRELVEDTYRATKLSALGLSKTYRVDVFSGCQKGLTGGTPNRTLQGTYKPEIYKYYVSHTKNKTDFAAGMEEKADNRNNIFKSKSFVFGIPIIILVFYFAYNSLMSYFDPNKFQKDENPIIEKQQYKPSAPSKNQIQKNKNDNAIAEYLERDISKEHLPLSQKYRIVGKINGTFLIYSKNGTREFDHRLCDKFINTKEEYCILNKEIVTWYSSINPSQGQDRNYIDNNVEDIF